MLFRYNLLLLIIKSNTFFNTMNESYSQGIKEFLALSVDDLKKMMTNSLSDRNIEINKWKEIVRLLYKEHYLLNNNESLAYCEIYTSIFYKEIQNKLKSNKPYVSQIISDPNNTLSPFVNIIDEVNQVKAGFLSKPDLEKYKENLEKIRNEIDKLLASNQELFDIFQEAYTELRLTGNTCVKREIVDMVENEFKLYHIPLNTITIYKDFNYLEPVYFFREILLTYADFENYFPDEISRTQCLNRYSDIDKPENKFSKKTIKVIENTFYCVKTNKTIIKFYLDGEDNFLEKNERVKDYKIYWYFQINARDKIYGKIDEKDYQLLSNLREKQLLWKNILDLRAKVERPKQIDVVALVQEKPLQADFQDGEKFNQQIREINLNKVQNISVLPEHIASFNGNLRNQNLEDPENLNHVAFLSNIHAQNLEQFMNFLGFNEAEKTNLLLTQQREPNRTATEFKELLFAGSVDKRQLEILESFTGSFYIFMIDFYIGNFYQKISQFQIKRGKNFINSLNTDYNELENNLFYDVISLDYISTDEEAKNNPFSFVLKENPLIQDIKQRWATLNQVYQEAEDEEEKNKIASSILEFEKNYKEYITLNVLPTLIKYKNEKQFKDDDYVDNLIKNIPQDLLSFVVNFKKYSNTIKFKLASAEANAMQNQESQNYLKMLNTSLDIGIKTNLPEVIKEIITMFKITENLPIIAKDYNIMNKLLTGEKLKKALEEQQEEEMRRQMQLAQAQQGNPIQ